MGTIARVRAVFILLCIVFAVSHFTGERPQRPAVVARAIIGGNPAAEPTPGNTPANPVGTGTGTESSSTTSTTTTTTQSTSSSSPTPTQNSPTPPPQTTPSAQPPTTTPPSTTSQTSQSLISSDSVLTNSDGGLSTVVVFETPSPAADTSSPSPTSSPASNAAVGTGTIVGLSVAGGIALLGVVAFFVWKFTRKRLVDYDDEAIKWPELNSHGGGASTYALPTNATGKSGIGQDDPSDLSRHNSGSMQGHPAYANTEAADSVANLYPPGADPYAVPPLPHQNPNVPYHDDPNAYGAAAFYDPYRGPIPQTFNDGASMDSHGHGASGGYGGAEAIPMSNLAPGGVAGRRSPGPQMAYGDGRAASPGPSLGGGGRQSPGPGPAYGAYDRSRSPGPAAFQAQAGRRSPGPGGAYGGGF